MIRFFQMAYKKKSQTTPPSYSGIDDKKVEMVIM